VSVQAEVTLYPLRTKELRVPIEAFCKVLDSHPVGVASGLMSTRVVGESAAVFAAIQKAFESVAKTYDVALIVKVSNACPERQTQG